MERNEIVEYPMKTARWSWVGGMLIGLGISGAACAQAQSAKDPLAFDPGVYTTVHIKLDGAPLDLRRYHVVYVSKPVRIDISKPVTMGGGPGGPGDPGGAGAPGGGPGGPGARAGGPPMGMFAPATDPLAYESMDIYVPPGTDAKSAIILQVNNAGWMASPLREAIKEGDQLVSTNDTDNTGAALKAGYVIVSVGTRSRGIQSETGEWAGKAPAVIVDTKAAIRYLRHNDSVMPGSAERIVITGTSGGGALSVAVAASGNSPDYYPYLAKIGAAGIDKTGHSTLRDDVFATIAYCPINDLGHADLAYEWQYHPVRTAANTNGGSYPAEMQSASAELMTQYPAYLTSLNLKREDGSALNAENLRDSIVALIRNGVEAGIARGEKIPALGEEFVVERRGPPGTGAGTQIHLKNEWLTTANGQVEHIDYEKYLAFVAALTPLKSVPAFDPTANTGHQGMSGESSLFGPPNLPYSNYTQYSWNHNEVKGDGSGPDDTGLNWNDYLEGPGKELAQQIKMTSPLPYLDGHSTSAPYWYVRHGLIDRDTSFAVQTTLYYAIKNNPQVKDVNFQLAWLQPHSGNYDVQEAYRWLARVMGAAGDPTGQHH